MCVRVIPSNMNVPAHLLGDPPLAMDDYYYYYYYYYPRRQSL